MLTFNHVEFNYANQPVFTDLNIQIEKGDFVFLIGKSGVGKTTLMRMVYMDLLPQNGYVEVDAHNSATMSKKDFTSLRKKLGIVFQDYQLLEDRNVYDNLAFVLHATGTPKQTIKRKVLHALTDVGLAHKQNNMPQNLSGGEKQRVAIARAIINEPVLVLADEPTGNLDIETSDEIIEILKKVNQRGTTILLATHNYDIVRKVDAKIIRLDEGKAVKVTIKKKKE